MVKCLAWPAGQGWEPNLVVAHGKLIWAAHDQTTECFIEQRGLHFTIIPNWHLAFIFTSLGFTSSGPWHL